MDANAMTEERLAAIEANAAHDTVISYPEIDATPASVARGWCRIVRELCDEVRRLRAQRGERYG